MDFKNKKNKDKKEKKGKKKQSTGEKIFSQITTVVLIIAVFIVISSYISNKKDTEVMTVSELATLVTEKKVKEIKVELNDVIVTKNDGTILKGKKEREGTLSETLKNLGVSDSDLILANPYFT